MDRRAQLRGIIEAHDETLEPEAASLAALVETCAIIRRTLDEAAAEPGRQVAGKLTRQARALHGSSSRLIGRQRSEQAVRDLVSHTLYTLREALDALGEPLPQDLDCGVAGGERGSPQPVMDFADASEVSAFREGSPMSDVEDLNQPPSPDYLKAGFWTDEGELRPELAHDAASHWGQALVSNLVPSDSMMLLVEALQRLAASASQSGARPYTAAERQVIERDLVNHCDAFEPLERLVSQSLAHVNNERDLVGLWHHAQHILRYVETFEAMRNGGPG